VIRNDNEMKKPNRVNTRDIRPIREAQVKKTTEFERDEIVSF
jgi:predicted secreted Zn-dependent protease